MENFNGDVFLVCFGCVFLGALGGVFLNIFGVQGISRGYSGERFFESSRRPHTF